MKSGIQQTEIKLCPNHIPEARYPGSYSLTTPPQHPLEILGEQFLNQLVSEYDHFNICLRRTSSNPAIPVAPSTATLPAGALHISQSPSGSFPTAPAQTAPLSAPSQTAHFSFSYPLNHLFNLLNKKETQRGVEAAGTLHHPRHLPNCWMFFNSLKPGSGMSIADVISAEINLQVEASSEMKLVNEDY